LRTGSTFLAAAGAAGAAAGAAGAAMAGAAAGAAGAFASSASTANGAMTKAMTIQRAIKDFLTLSNGAFKAEPVAGT